MNKIQKHIDYILLIIATVSFLPEIFFYRGILANKLGFAADALILLIFAIILIKRIFTGICLTGRFFKVYFFITLPSFIILSILLKEIDIFTYPNFIYSNLHINKDSFFDFVCYMALFTICFFDFSVTKKYWRQLIFLGGLFGLFVFIFFKWREGFIFYSLDREDSILEYSQFFIYLIISFLSLASFVLLRKIKEPVLIKTIWQILFILNFVFFFVVAGEEISWGQRIFGIETPKNISENNIQNEITIHNNKYLFDYVYYGYLSIGFYGMFSWLINYLPIKIKGFKLAQYIKPFLSKWYLSTYFLVITGYVIWRYTSRDGAFDIWEETAESFLAVGILILFSRSYYKLLKR